MQSLAFSLKLFGVARYAQRQLDQNHRLMSNRKSTTLPNHREQLRAKGWTLRPAAEVLGVHWTHLHKVLSGQRHSARLLARLADLPTK